MKKTNLLKVLFGTAVLMSACTTDEIVEQQGNAVSNLEQIQMTAENFVYTNGSRTDFDVTNPDAAKFIWTKGDVVGIFPNKGHQVDFPIETGDGTNTAVFNGGGWALKPASTYAAYYPYAFENKTMNSIPVSYEGQKQIGNATTAHLGKYDFMAAVSTNPEAGKVNFNFKHLGALVKLDITTPKAMAVTSVTLKTDENLLTKTGTIDLAQSDIKIVKVESANAMKVLCQDIATTEANKVATIYCMMPAVDLTGKTLKVEVTDADAVVYNAKLTNITKIEAGNAYALAATVKEAGKAETVKVDNTKVKVFVQSKESIKVDWKDMTLHQLTDGKFMTMPGDENNAVVDHSFFVCRKNWENKWGGDYGAALTINAGTPIRLAKFVAHRYYDKEGSQCTKFEIYRLKKGQELTPDWEQWELMGKYDFSKVTNPVYADGDIVNVGDDGVAAQYYRILMLENWNVSNGGMTGASDDTYSYTFNEFTLYEYKDAE